MQFMRLNFDPLPQGGDDVTKALRKIDLNFSDLNTGKDSYSSAIDRLANVEVTIGELGDVSRRNVGKVAGTVAAGDDPRFSMSGLRNKLINGNFDFWQRGTTLPAVAGALRYLADRWRTQSGGSSIAVYRMAFDAAQSDVPGNPRFYHRSVVYSVAGAGNFALMNQTIEGVMDVSGRTVTMSFWARSDTTRKMALEFVTTYGSGGSPVEGGAIRKVIELTTTWTKYTWTFTAPVLTGRVVGGANNDYWTITFWFDGGVIYAGNSSSIGQQSGVFDMARVQVEYGDQDTDFEVRPSATEFMMCQRYYEKSYNYATVPGSADPAGRVSWFVNQTQAINQYAHVRFSVIKRGTPSIVTYASESAGKPTSVSQDDGTTVGVTSYSAVGEAGFQISWTNGPGRFGGSFHYTADAEI